MKYVFPLLFIFTFNNFLFAQWTHTSGPSGGVLQKMVKINQTLFVLNQYNIYRSMDKGESWIGLNKTFEMGSEFSAIASYENNIYVSSSNGIYLSTDLGENWKPINKGIEQVTFRSIYATGKKIYASTFFGKVFYSPDNGATWTEKSKGLSSQMIQEFTFLNSKIYAGGEKLYVSDTSSGTSAWTEINIEGLSVNGISSLTSSANAIYVGDVGHVFLSKDFGNTWTQLPLETLGTITSMHTTSDSVYLTSSFGSLYYSNDNGTSWIKYQNSQVQWVYDAVLLKDTIISATDHGVFVSFDNGVSWINKNAGIKRIQVAHLATNDSLIFAASYHTGVFRSGNKGTTWESISNGISNSTAHTFTTIANKLIVTSQNRVLRSTDWGDSWETISSPVAIGNFFAAVAFDKGILAGAVNTLGVYISLDTGRTWVLANTENLDLNTGYSCLTVKGDTIMVGTFDRDIYISENRGATWRRSFIEEFGTITKLSIIRGDLYAVTYNGIFRSENLGVKWISISSGLSDLGCYDLVTDGSSLYLGTSHGVFVSKPHNPQWFPFNRGLRELVYSLAIKDNFILAGTYTSSVWVNSLDDQIPAIITGVVSELKIQKGTSIDLKLSDLIVSDFDNSFPQSFTLSVVEGQNYTVSNLTVTPHNDFVGILTVPVFVSNGKVNSNTFDLSIAVEAPTAVEAEVISSVSVSPNPTTTLVVVELKSRINGKISLAIVDLYGKTIAKKIINKNEFISKEEFGFDDVRPGTYLLSVSDGKKLSVYKKIVKN